YDTKEVLTSLGIGEALISALDEKGRPTPLAATLLRAPMSRMDVLTAKELEEVIDNSKLIQKYNETIDRESAYEILNEKIEKAEAKARKDEEEEKATTRTTSSRSRRSSSRQNPVVKVLTSATFIRGVLGILRKAMK
ncbi:helicase HerA-like domain-containing protein, partial [Muriicola sp.]